MTDFGISAADATPNHGWYASVEAGANWSSAEGIGTQQLSGVIVINAPPPPWWGNNVKAALDTGWAGFAAVGLELGTHFRVEGELGYRSNNISAFEVVSQKTLMINGLVTLPVLENLTLFAGAGLGANQVSWDNYAAYAHRDTDNALFAYQGIVGLNWDLTDQIGLFAKYRYLGTSGVDMPGLATNWDDQTVIAIHGDTLTSQTVTVGVKFAL